MASAQTSAAGRGRRPGRRVALAVLAALVLLAGLVLGRSGSSGPRPPTGTGAADFVSRAGGQLRLAGAATRFSGFNTNGFPHIQCGGGPGTRADVDAYFSNFTNDRSWVRTWVFPGADLTELDHEVAAARASGSRLILTLSNSYASCNDPGGEKTEGWHLGGWRGTHEAHIREVVSRYRDDPTIAFWELQNEAHGAGNAAIRAFFADASALVKSIDPNHLVSSGTSAPSGFGGTSGLQDVHSPVGIDIVSVHTYDPGKVEPQAVVDAAAAAVALDKPLYWGELGIAAEQDSWPARRDQVVAQMDHAFRTLPNLAGVSYWAMNWEIDGAMNTGPADRFLPAALRDYFEPA